MNSNDPPKRNGDGRFGLGNEFWRLAEGFGREKIFETPRDLVDKASEYFQWVEDNPIVADKVFGTGLRMPVNHPRAPTIEGFCAFAGIGRSTWGDYSKRDGFAEACELVQTFMFRAKLEGAAAGVFNAQIITRELGLVDRAELTNPDGNMAPPNVIILRAAQFPDDFPDD